MCLLSFTTTLVRSVFPVPAQAAQSFVKFINIFKKHLLVSTPYSDFLFSASLISTLHYLLLSAYLGFNLLIYSQLFNVEACITERREHYVFLL